LVVPTTASTSGAGGWASQAQASATAVVAAGVGCAVAGRCGCGRVAAPPAGGCAAETAHMERARVISVITFFINPPSVGRRRAVSVS
jgi:hypothetical protein